jgi:hypothetical protein
MPLSARTASLLFPLTLTTAAAPTLAEGPSTVAEDGAASMSAQHAEARRWDRFHVVLTIESGGAHVDGAALLRAVDAGAQVWNAVGAGPRLTVVAADDETGPPPDLAAYDGKNRVAVFQGPWQWDEDAAAVTLTWRRTGSDTIEEIDLLLNPAWRWRTDGDDRDETDPGDDDAGDDARDAFDVQNVVTHELGHALGLPDLAAPDDATMYFQVKPGETEKRDLSDVDVTHLVELYDGMELGSSVATGCTQADGAPAAAALVLVIARSTRRVSQGRSPARGP